MLTYAYMSHTVDREWSDVVDCDNKKNINICDSKTLEEIGLAKEE